MNIDDILNNALNEDGIWKNGITSIDVLALINEVKELRAFVVTVYDATQYPPELFIGYREPLWLKSWGLKAGFK